MAIFIQGARLMRNAHACKAGLSASLPTLCLAYHPMLCLKLWHCGRRPLTLAPSWNMASHTRSVSSGGRLVAKRHRNQSVASSDTSQASSSRCLWGLGCWDGWI